LHGGIAVAIMHAVRSRPATALAILSTGILLVLTGAATAAYPGQNGKIAFSSARDGNSEIYSMNPDASGQTRLTNDPGIDIDPAWTAGGTAIAYTGDDDIWVMNADGSGKARLTSDEAADVNPAWSPDGTKLAFASRRDGPGEIYVMNADGAAQTRLTSDPASDDTPAWSPDSSSIAFTSDRRGNKDIFVMNTDGANQRPLTTDGGADIAPNWSPDGSRIAFWSNRDGNPEIYVMSADGTGQTRLTRNLEIDIDPAWSPDGKSIVFTSNRDGNTEIYVMNANGTGQTRLTTMVSDDTTADWQPIPIPHGTGFMTDAYFTGHFRQSEYFGRLTVKGQSSGSGARLRLVLRRGTKIYLSREVVVDAGLPPGPTGFRFAVPRTLVPGPYALDVLPGAGPAEYNVQHIPVDLPAPLEGVVRRAWASESKGGEPIVRFPPATAKAWANFQFAALPRRGSITISWYYGPKSEPIGVVTMPRRPTVASWVGTVRGDPLRRGSREAVLRAGKTVVKRLRFRVG
jgi:Tol biopolymer transport system component